MRLGTVVSGSGALHTPTVYTVLAQSARAHSRRYLATEALLAGAAAVLVVLWQPRWWPVASLALAVGLYASWGLLTGGTTGEERVRRHDLLRLLLAGLATVATLAGLAGLAVKAFWGTAPGPYGLCHHADGTSYACEADGSRRPVSRPPTQRGVGAD